MVGSQCLVRYFCLVSLTSTVDWQERMVIYSRQDTSAIGWLLHVLNQHDCTTSRYDVEFTIL